MASELGLDPLITFALPIGLLVPLITTPPPVANNCRPNGAISELSLVDTALVSSYNSEGRPDSGYPDALPPEGHGTRARLGASRNK